MRSLKSTKKKTTRTLMQSTYNINHRRLAELFSTNHQAFVNVMMLEELGLVVDDSNPVVNGIVNTISFMILGFIPLIPYLVAKINGDEEHQYIWIIGIGAFELFSLGFAKSTLIQSSIPRRFFSGFETVFFAAIALAAGYGIGKIFENQWLAEYKIISIHIVIYLWVNYQNEMVVNESISPKSIEQIYWTNL